MQKQIFSFLYSQSLTLSNLIKRSTKFQITWEQKKYLKKNRKFYSSRWPCFSFEKVKTIWYYLLLLLIWWLILNTNIITNIIVIIISLFIHTYIHDIYIYTYIYTYLYMTTDSIQQQNSLLKLMNFMIKIKISKFIIERVKIN